MDKEKVERRQKEFLKTPDAEEIRRQREDDHVQLRKAKRSEQFTKRRGKLPPASFEGLPASLLHALPQLSQRSVTAAAKAVLLLNFLEESTDEELTLSAISILRKAIASETCFKSALPHTLISSGIADVLSKLLSKSNASILQEATWCLLNLTSGPSDMATAVATPHIISRVVELLRHPDLEVTSNCMWTLGNLAGDESVQLQAFIRSLDLVPKVVEVGQRHNEFSLQDLSVIAWLLSALIRRNSPLRNDTMFDSVVLVKLICRDNAESVIQEAVVFLALISQRSDMGVSTLIHTSFLPQVITWLGHSQPQIRLGALRVLGNVCSSSQDEHTASVLSAGLLDALQPLTLNPSNEIRRELLWTLSNILVGPDEHKLAVIRGPIASFIISSAEVMNDKVQMEASHCLYNFLEGESAVDFALKLSSLGALEAIRHIIELSKGEVVLMALKVLDAILLAGAAEATREKGSGTNKQAVKWDEIGGLSKMEDLQNGCSDAVYEEVLRLMNTYYGIEEDKEGGEALLPPPERFEFS